ncbi:hypothetical protein F4804DRAFT_329754 [Jackrogersella minutella]|nr:hypothetical protein F4804DRAFT_329754 [Jackrogersella minutella]
MDPSAMDFLMHQEHVGSASSSSNMEHAARSACPALRASAEHNQNPPMFPSRSNYHFDPVHGNPHFWQTLPSPYSRWSADPVFQPTPPIMPPSPGQVSPPPYTPNGLNPYNPHQSSPYRYRPMLSLQRIGGTAPIQHSQGNFSGSNQGQQTQSGIGGGTNPGAGTHGSTHGSTHSATHSPRPNGTLPSINSIPSLPTNHNHNLQTQTFPHNSRQTQPQPSGRHSPPPFVRQSSMPSTSLSMAEVTVSSSGGRNEAGPSQPASSSPPRQTPAASRTANMSREVLGTGRATGFTPTHRRGLTRLPSSESGFSSDDESDHDAVAMSLIEAAVSGPPAEAGVGDERLRAQQLMRGTLSAKRVASKKALTSLESVAISTLPENERTCVICYNDYGAETPEGNSEQPLRLPRCKHVFGDHCIKKWFEESDSCPYCRDRVPSEPQYRHAMNSHNVYRFLRQHQQIQMSMRTSRENDRGDPESLGRPSDSVLNGFAALASSPFADLEYGAMGGPATRRANGPDGMSMYNSRTPAWHGSSGERHSPLPFNEVSENRRRVRPRHGSLRGFPPTRPHFPPSNNASQTQQYPWMSRASQNQNQNQPQNHMHNRQHSTSTQNPAGRSAYDISVPPFPYQPQMAAPSEPYLNPLNITSPTGTTEEYPTLPHMRTQQHASPISPTFSGPEVYMTNADEPTFGGSGSHQHS